MAAVLACGSDAVLSHRSAGQLWGIVPGGGHLPEVTRATASRLDRISVHRGAVPADERGEVLGIPVTSVPRTVFDLAGISPRRQVERAMHEVEVRRLTDRLSLPDLLARYPGRRGAGVLRELLRAKEPVGVTQNDFEELFVAFLDEHRLPRPRLNATLALRGQLLKPDCMWERERLLGELDGRAAHATDGAFERDRRRDRILLAEGWRSTRITWRQLQEEPDTIAADLRDQLAVAA